MTTRAPAFEIELPATSANLGPAFDAAALALDLYLRLRAQPASDFSIRAEGVDADICGNRDSIILKTYCEVLEAGGGTAPPIALQIENEIPIGKGFGSSAAARLAGIALAMHFGGLSLTDGQVLNEAARREGHPDNAAACWLGGLVVTKQTEREVVALRIDTPARWSLLLIVPDQPLATEKGRRVLPERYTRGDVVANVQGALLLISALGQGRPDLLPWAFDDRFHQPYRATLCPLLEPVRALAGKAGILGAVLSGAGPAVLVFADQTVPVDETKRHIAEAVARAGLKAEVHATAVASRGARDSRKVLAEGEARR
ncbi:MAG: homoserine kinase [Acidobacteriia bacterium]|nr:homoserine kinase [Terriglobia bacterium]